MQVLLYIEDVPGAITELRRVLRSGGRIAVLALPLARDHGSELTRAGERPTANTRRTAEIEGVAAAAIGYYLVGLVDFGVWRLRRLVRRDASTGDYTDPPGK